MPELDANAEPPEKVEDLPSHRNPSFLRASMNLLYSVPQN